MNLLKVSNYRGICNNYFNYLATVYFSSNNENRGLPFLSGIG